MNSTARVSKRLTDRTTASLRAALHRRPNVGRFDLDGF
jgi:hypothetical protein